MPTWLVVISCDGARREDADAVERAAVANHLEEPRVVARGGQQARRRPRSSGAGRRRSAPCPSAPSGARDDPCRRLPLAYTAASRSRSAGGRKNCVSFMPSGPVIRVRMNSSSGMPGRALDDAAEDVGVVAVDPGSPGCATNGSVPSRSIVSQIGSSLSAVYQPLPAAGPGPLAVIERGDVRSVP